MPRSRVRPSRSSAADNCASPVSDRRTSCPASANTKAISAPISPAPTTPIFSLAILDAPFVSAQRARQFPGLLAHRDRGGAGGDRVGAGGGAVDRPLGDPLEDRR